MERTSAIEVVTALRAEVVQLVGICGNGTHPLTELLEALERGEVRPEEAVEKAAAIRNRTTDFR